jgi:molybdenum cofactor guanylyltransferase
MSFGGIQSIALDVSCIVLAGGKSKRLGRNKVVEIVGNKSLLERVVSSLSFFNSEILIVTGKESIIPQLTAYPKVKQVEDIIPGAGAFGGVYTGLVNSTTYYNVVVACDMPFINQRLLSYMLGLAESFDVVIPKVNNILEPLHAVYSKNCIAPIEFLIKQNRLSILELFPMVKVRIVENNEIDRFDQDHQSFFNINTEADLDAGKELARKEEIKGD